MEFLPHTFQLLLAPPAWGKTRLFASWTQAPGAEFLFISPLRALALEVQAANPSVWVALPEELVRLDWEGLAREKPRLVVVWDEVHLVPEWGLTFRHAILDAWYGFCVSGLAGVGFTATLTPATREFLATSLAENHQWLLTGDAGNFAFKTAPTRTLAGPRSGLRELVVAHAGRGRTLIFCATRGEVDQWLADLKDTDVRVWGCKGGETAAFAARLAQGRPPDVIVATSCLSHGVNLPALDRVVILDGSAPHWLRHQMQTRAGRRGESYEVWVRWETESLTLAQRLLAIVRFSGRLLQHRFQQTIRANWYEP